MGTHEHTVRWPRATGGSSGWTWQRWREDQVWGFDDLTLRSGIGVRKAGKRTWLYTAPDGTDHDTMRELLMTFRLRMCDCDRKTDQLELLRSVLGHMAHEIHRTDLDAFVDLAFAGQVGWMESYVHWLERERLVGCIGATMRDVDLSPEGAAIRRMLDLTAPGANIDPTPLGALERFDRLYPGRRARS